MHRYEHFPALLETVRLFVWNSSVGVSRSLHISFEAYNRAPPRIYIIC